MLSTIKELAILSISATILVCAVRFLLITGIDSICNALKWSAKAKGQLIGYATSLPELVVILTSAMAGVFSAGFWNVASSNIINTVLFFLAIGYYRQLKELRTARFIDEAAFALISIAVPMLMFKMQLSPGYRTAFMLFGIFALYKWLDIFFNPASTMAFHTQAENAPSLRMGLPMLLGGILLVMMAGYFLGNAAGTLILRLKTPAWLIGWFLGIITSIPEMTSFFEVYRREKQSGRAAQLHDTQQALDALVASNLCNLGIILPAGMLVYMLMT